MNTKTTKKTSEPRSLHMTIRMDALVMLPDNQVRAETNYGTVKAYRELMATGVTFPPIKVAMVDPEDEAKGLVLVDGWHRVTAMQGLGLTRVEAEVVPMRTNEYQWEAVKANRAHGLPLKRADKRKCFRAYIKAEQHRVGAGYKSEREMARDLVGIVARSTLPLWMQQDFPAIYRAAKFGETETEGNQDLGKGSSMDKDYQAAAKAALNEFMACMRALNDPSMALGLARDVALVATEVAEAVTGKREWPRSMEEMF